MSLLVVLAFSAVGCRATQQAATSATPSPTASTTPLPAKLTSFRYTLSAEASNILGAPPAAAPGGKAEPVRVRVTGEVASATRQRSSTHLDLGFGTLDSERVQVDGRTWTRDGADPWVEERGAARDTGTRSLGLSLDPGVFLGSEAHERLRSTFTGLASTPERIDGVDTVRFQLTGAQVRTLFGEAPAGPATSIAGISEQWTVWLTRDRWLPMRLVTDAVGEQGGRVHLELSIRDHNANIVVEPPK